MQAIDQAYSDAQNRITVILDDEAKKINFEVRMLQSAQLNQYRVLNKRQVEIIGQRIEHLTKLHNRIIDIIDDVYDIE